MKNNNLNLKKLGAITIGTLILFSAVGVVEAQNNSNLPVNPNGANVISNSQAVANMAANRNNQARLGTVGNTGNVGTVGIAPVGSTGPTQTISPVNPVNAGVGMPVGANNPNAGAATVVNPTSVVPPQGNVVSPSPVDTQNNMILNSLPMNDPSKLGTAATANINVNSGSPIAQSPAGFDMTPLLQEYARKSALLKIKQLNKDIEKLDKPENAPQTTPLDPSKTAMPGTVVLPNAPVQSTPVKQVAIEEEQVPQVRVFSIYGFDGQLMAKVGTGSRGGYVVSKGDILPNGRVVTDISANYITVSKNKNGKGGSEKIFPTPSDNDDVASTTNNSNTTAGMPGMSSPPIAVPPKLSVSSQPLTLKLH